MNKAVRMKEMKACTGLNEEKKGFCFTHFPLMPYNIEQVTFLSIFKEKI